MCIRDSTTITAVEDIHQGHKMAIAPIKEGENVIKYGFPIGHATEMCIRDRCRTAHSGQRRR